jgi:WD40 repeat protein
LKRILLKVLVSLTLVVMLVSTVYAALPTQLWSDAVPTYAIDLSKDGQYVALVTPLGGELRFYGRGSGTPLWTWSSSETLFSVAISADGDCVVAGGFPHVYFWKNAKIRTSATADPTWISAALGGAIFRRCLEISDDGNYVAACGTGQWVFYWANAKGKSGTDIATAWRSPQFSNVECVDLSGDGDCVAAGIVDSTLGIAVAYWKNARTLTGNDLNPDWKSSSPDNIVVDIAVSSDGNYVAAATVEDASVHYWANAKSLTGDPDHTWYYGSGISFSCIDMSSDGNAVIAGSGEGVYLDVFPQKGETVKAALGVTVGGAVYFWSGAKGLTGKPQNPTWTYTTEGGIHDVAIDDAGTYMAADGNLVAPGEVHFFNSGGTLLWSYPIEFADKVSISGDGATLAVGTAVADTGYLLSTGYSSAVRTVGGIAIPVNKFELLTPYLALAGLVIAVSAIVVVKRRRH